MNNVIQLRYEGQPVRFTGEAWLHATKLAERFGKRIDHWLDNAETLKYIRALDEVLTGAESEILDTRNSGYVKTSRARVDRGGGTWLHPRLGVAFARWLDAKFSVWCDMRVEEILHGNQSAMDRFNRACRAFDVGAAVASTHGRGLVAWKQEKPLLQLVVSRERNLLQMTFDPEWAPP